eukprot:gene4669-8241_t
MSVGKSELKHYYESYFPFDSFYKWVCGNNPTEFHKREFSFTIDDIYLRYKSYKTVEDFKKSVTSKIPNKIDIGPVYTVSPSEQHTIPVSKFKPESKEYVIDIDISDYDNVRFCGCSEAKVCPKCWNLMTCGSKILDELLENVFGCENRLWVFSGRRGIHCWVSDSDIKTLKNNERASMSDFLHIYGEKKGFKISKSAITHPSFDIDSNIFKIAEKYFLKIYCKDMIQLLDDPNHYSKFYNLINNQKIKEDVMDQLPTFKGNFIEKWNSIKDIFSKHKSKSNLVEIVYTFVYPRLDLAVSKTLNHLLKSPFCVHPSTGNICVPFNIKEGFDISKTPNILI